MESRFDIGKHMYPYIGLFSSDIATIYILLYDYLLVIQERNQGKFFKKGKKKNTN